MQQKNQTNKNPNNNINKEQVTPNQMGHRPHPIPNSAGWSYPHPYETLSLVKQQRNKRNDYGKICQNIN